MTETLQKTTKEERSALYSKLIYAAAHEWSSFPVIVERIEKAFKVSMAGKTARRHLKILIAQGRVTKVGQSNATRYRSDIREKAKSTETDYADRWNQLLKGEPRNKPKLPGLGNTDAQWRSKEKRAAILAFIWANPGATSQDILRNFDVSKAALSNHVSTLRGGGEIHSYTRGIFYPGPKPALEAAE